MRLTRCYLPAPLVSGSELLLPENAAAHVVRVLRARAGDALIAFDGGGGEYRAEVLAIDRGRVTIRVGEHHPRECESPLAVTLLQALSRGERMDFVVQKATELGVVAIVPVASARSVVKLSASAADRRVEHWRAIAIGACEQSGRNRIPVIAPVQSLQAACASAATGNLKLMLAPGAGAGLGERVTSQAVTLLIGPEGGLDAEEQALAEQAGFQACRLGPRVLRAETAPLAALAALQALAGDLAR